MAHPTVENSIVQTCNSDGTPTGEWIPVRDIEAFFCHWSDWGCMVRCRNIHSRVYTLASIPGAERDPEESLLLAAMAALGYASQVANLTEAITP